MLQRGIIGGGYTPGNRRATQLFFRVARDTVTISRPGDSSNAPRECTHVCDKPYQKLCRRKLFAELMNIFAKCYADRGKALSMRVHRQCS
jgi:hypothetical protein